MTFSENDFCDFQLSLQFHSYGILCNFHSDCGFVNISPKCKYFVVYEKSDLFSFFFYKYICLLIPSWMSFSWKRVFTFIWIDYILDTMHDNQYYAHFVLIQSLFFFLYLYVNPMLLLPTYLFVSWHPIKCC